MHKSKRVAVKQLVQGYNFIHFQENQMKTKEGFHPHRNTHLHGDWGEYFALNYRLKNQLKGMECNRASHLASFWHSEIVISYG